MAVPRCGIGSIPILVIISIYGLKKRINDSQLYYGVREGAFALHHAVWLAKALPDSFPLQSRRNGDEWRRFKSAVLSRCRSDIDSKYFGRLQQTDGSWRWDTHHDSTSTQTVAMLKGIMQPFMVGLLLNALIDVHRLSTDTSKGEYSRSNHQGLQAFIS